MVEVLKGVHAIDLTEGDGLGLRARAPEPMKSEDVEPLAKKVATNATLDAYWVGTQVQLDDKGQVLRFICEWNAKDVKSVEEVFAKVPELPYDGIYPMTKLDSIDFRE